MGNKTQYMVVTADTVESLEKNVNSALNSGYVLQGGVSMTMTVSYIRYAQAMIFVES